MEEISKILVTVVIENNKNQTVKRIIQVIEKQLQSQFKNLKPVSVEEIK